MTKKTFSVTYDRESDVLYINSKNQPAIRGIEAPNGIVWRYDSGGDLIGATVLDFYNGWFSHHDQLASELAAKFAVPKRHFLSVLDHAMEH